MKPHRIYIYQNLPNGGAKQLFNNLTEFLSKKFEVYQLEIDQFLRPRNFLEYWYFSVILSPILQQKVSKKINSKHNQILLAHHTWLTKSPFILRLFKNSSIYICHEPMREYYDLEHIRLQTQREKFINILRYPLKTIDRENVRSAKIIISNSRKSYDNILKAYGKASVVIYPGIQVDKYINDQKRLNQVISVGAINKLKNQEFYVKVISKLPKKIRPKLILVGSGVDRKYLNYITGLATKLDVKLRAYTDISNKKLVELYSKSSLFLFSPINEPFGLVVLEAMASGIPLIAYKYGGGYSEIITSKNGELLSNLDEVHWAGKINQYLVNKKLWAKVSKTNIQMVKRFSIDHYNKQIEQVIRSEFLT